MKNIIIVTAFITLSGFTFFSASAANNSGVKTYSGDSRPTYGFITPCPDNRIICVNDVDQN